MKKIITCFLLTILCAMSILCAYADEIAPCAGTENTLSAEITLSSSGGTGTAWVFLMEGYRADTTVYVQKLVNGSWTTFASGSAGSKVGIEFSAIAGVSYRVYAVATITNTSNGAIERLTRYSRTLSY